MTTSTNPMTIIGSPSGKARLSYVIEYALYSLLNSVGVHVELSQVPSDVYMVLGHEGSPDVDFKIKTRFYPRSNDERTRFYENLKFTTSVSNGFLKLLSVDCNEQEEVAKAFQGLKSSMTDFEELIKQVFKITAIVAYPHLTRALYLPHSALPDKQQAQVVFMVTSTFSQSWLSKVFIIKALIHGFKVPLATVVPDGYFMKFYETIGKETEHILSSEDEDGEWKWR